MVDFAPLGIGNIMNMAFGDLLPDDSIDDKANSNNGDITTYSKEFAFAGVIDTNNGINVIPYDPKSNYAYFGFLIKRIS